MFFGLLQSCYNVVIIGFLLLLVTTNNEYHYQLFLINKMIVAKYMTNTVTVIINSSFL